MNAASGRRPRLLGVVLGTATAVGKTWLTCELAHHARGRNAVVAVRKPVQSFDGDEAPRSPTDAELLSRVTGEAVEHVCAHHRWYPRAMAPPMAATALGLPAFGVGELVAELTWPDGVDIGLVETAGGTASPIADDADSAGLARLLAPDLAVLVADAGLGTINSVRLAMGLLDGLDTVVFLNRFDPADELHRGNRAWLEQRERLTIATDAHALAEQLCVPR